MISYSESEVNVQWIFHEINLFGHAEDLDRAVIYLQSQWYYDAHSPYLVGHQRGLLHTTDTAESQTWYQ